MGWIRLGFRLIISIVEIKKSVTGSGNGQLGTEKHALRFRFNIVLCTKNQIQEPADFTSWLCMAPYPPLSPTRVPPKVL